MLIAATTQNGVATAAPREVATEHNGDVATAAQKLGTTEQQHQNGGLLLPQRIGVATAVQKRRMGCCNISYNR
jgi:hypothetical protein